MFVISIKQLLEAGALCSTFSVEGEMRELIKKMYDMVSTDRRTINVSSNVKGVIDDFMKLEW